MNDPEFPRQPKQLEFFSTDAKAGVEAIFGANKPQAEPIPPTAMPSDVYLVRLERLVTENAKLRAVLGECLGGMRAMISFVEDIDLGPSLGPCVKSIEEVLKASPIMSGPAK